MTEAPFFSVIICTYQRYDRLPLAIESVLKQDIAPDLFDVWVIDNTPPCPERTASRKTYEGIERLHYVEIDTPGLANARNVAAQKAAARWLAFLDDDAIADVNWLSHYHETISSLGDELGVIGGRIDPLFEVPKPVWLDNQLLPFLSLLNWSKDVTELPQGITPFGANVAIRRDLLVQKGGFNPFLGRNGADSKNLMSGEEAELFQYLRDIGKKIYYTPFARVAHFIPASRLTRSWFRRRMAWQVVSDLPFFDPTEEQKFEMWVGLMKYLTSVPREQIPYMGLFWDTEEPALFLRQVECVRFVTHFLLSQGEYPEQMRR